MSFSQWVNALQLSKQQQYAREKKCFRKELRGTLKKKTITTIWIPNYLMKVLSSKNTSKCLLLIAAGRTRVWVTCAAWRLRVQRCRRGGKTRRWTSRESQMCRICIQTSRMPFRSKRGWTKSSGHPVNSFSPPEWGRHITAFLLLRWSCKEPYELLLIFGLNNGIILCNKCLMHICIKMGDIVFFSLFIK